MPRPSQYRHIRAWGTMLGSFEYYIQDSQRRASREDAPIDAVYQQVDGTWRSFSDIEREDTKDRILGILERMPIIE